VPPNLPAPCGRGGEFSLLKRIINRRPENAHAGKSKIYVWGLALGSYTFLRSIINNPIVNNTRILWEGGMVDTGTAGGGMDTGTTGGGGGMDTDTMGGP
jgi:hypothetical protein